MADPEVLLGEWLGAEMDCRPTVASDLGLDGYDDRLDDVTAERWSAQAQRDRRWSGRIAELTLADLALDEQVDLTLVLAEMAGRSVMDDWTAWRRDPTVYLRPCLDGIFGLWLRRSHPEAELVAASVARLGHIPEVLASARANLTAEIVPPLLVERAVAAAIGGARYFAELLPAEADDGHLRAELASAANRAATELRDFAVFLDGLCTAGRGDWAIGEERYSALLRDKELIAVDAGDLHALGRATYDELTAEMDRLAAVIDPDAGGWRAVLGRLDADHPATPEAMRTAYAEACVSARRFLVERGLVTLPDGEECRVEASPVFQRPVLAVASYVGPPAFTASRTGHFFVPFPPDGESVTGIAERLASNSHHSIPTTAVHEAYPGHHWHMTWSASSPRSVRKVLTTPYFVEGWALYAEAMMHEAGYFSDPRDVLCHLAARLLRAARVVVDTALHSGDMTFDEAVTHMTERGGLTPTVARAEVRRYCAWPTQAASYLTGAVGIEALRDRWQADRRGDLRAFHDAVAAEPGLPVALVEKLLFP